MNSPTLVFDHNGLYTLAYPRLYRPPEDISLQYTFNPSDPAAIRLTLRSEITWFFDRTILKAALVVPDAPPFGFGDIKFATRGPNLLTQIHGHDGSIGVVSCLALPVEQFMADVDHTVPPSQVTYDIDHTITQLLEDA